MEAITTARTELAGIVSSAAEGDDAAFGRIIADHHDDMRRVCVFVARDAALADEAVQIAWSVAWQKLDSLNDPERLRPWLMRIAVNEAKRLLAKRGRRSQVEIASHVPSVASGVDPATGIERLDVLAAMDRLKPEDRGLIALRYVMGFDATELAAAMGMSPAATRQRLKRLLERLRKDLDR